MMPVMIPAENHPKAIGISELLSSKYRVSVGSENTLGEVVSYRVSVGSENTLGEVVSYRVSVESENTLGEVVSYRVSVGSENTLGEVVSGGSELNKSMHVLIVIVFNGVGHCLLRPNEETPTVILEESSDNNHESSILMRVLATMVPLELE